jgi:MtfA peptidase
VNLGESWNAGVVVLSWNSVKGGTRNMWDGRNVALHEFAHQLDLENGVVDGLPVVGGDGGWRERVERYSAWGRICAGEYELLRKQSAAGKRTVMNEYGGTNPAEFFAVATECFFEKPKKLRTKHPELYQELKTFYKQDPEKWTEQNKQG